MFEDNQLWYECCFNITDEMLRILNGTDQTDDVKQTFWTGSQCNTPVLLHCVHKNAQPTNV